ncbi:ABC transporter ATP-binding protein [Afifella sp. IM 167]|uniref:ABC transporter ATP-binding protein n=1 Tax=Afifella sp. IM 167 TaxID=2033586 RepID=UPI001CCACAD1|nr:ABC transporter ATP-binding protein [Afifella sp. IM 167]MBZ8132122.1 ABC transporter ATP-binding protein [Afifella sp. IM 167]
MSELLSVSDLSAGYGNAVVLSGVEFSLIEGGSLALLGRNGVGKTTLINTLVGLTTMKAGTIRLASEDITGKSPEARAAAGIGWVPQERNIFVSLTVEENLTAIARPGPWDVKRIYALFPRLKERRRNLGSQLSGGEQQMLAVGRALALNPKLILLDEPLEGLAPVIVDELLAALRRIIAEEGLSAIIVEQKARKILPFTHEALIMARGAIVHRAMSADLLADADALHAHLGVAERRMRQDAAHSASATEDRI